MTLSSGRRAPFFLDPATDLIGRPARSVERWYLVVQLRLQRRIRTYCAVRRDASTNNKDGRRHPAYALVLVAEAASFEPNHRELVRVRFAHPVVVPQKIPDGAAAGARASDEREELARVGLL